MDKLNRRRSMVAILSLLLCVLSWELTAALFFRHAVFGGRWLMPLKQILALAVSASLSVYVRVWARPLVQEYRRQGQPIGNTLSGLEIVAVTLMVVAASAFAVW